MEMDIKLNIVDFNQNYNDFYIMSNNILWIGTDMYGYPKSNTKILSCNLINNLAQISYISQWILFGDLNLITTVNKKRETLPA